MRYRLFVSSVALLLTSGGAFAADPVIYLPSETPAPTDAPFSWEGPYLGVHAGYARGGENDNQSQYFPDPYYVPTSIPADHFSVKGLLGGIHAGNSWQIGSLVYGFEADLDYSNLKGDANFDGAKYLEDGLRQAYGNLAFKSDIQASLRGRAGYAVDSWLFYGTGGVALARGKLTASGTYYETGTDYISSTTSDSQIHIGWTLGAGIEKAFTPNLIGRLEARYADFGSKSYNLGHFGEDVKADWHQATVTVGLSYKF